jgi:hypothetical protein
LHGAACDDLARRLFFHFRRVCHGLAHPHSDGSPSDQHADSGTNSNGDDRSAIIGLLPYYQYNSGLRYGYLGDGEGQTGDPNLMRTWLADARPRCVSFTPGYNAHGTVLTVGWRSPGPAALLDLDIFNGHWKINDFTFGSESALAQAMKTSSPIVRYYGQ